MLTLASFKTLPLFYVYIQFFVLELPKSKPTIATDKDKYDPGDTLMANCTSPGSKPAASLTFFLNNMPVSKFKM